ncbi:uncharacterized protein SOCE836_050440 [Sorangium cellulosum]|uniref:Uncharacterized protein n=1 Tax=Sorangium cellulosum TaxID=56 RepID=A0A4V0NGE5_SORCE|nr:uncharacterized protein SOCE836_050440 [Sorangium cellulosum]WCQ92268.1 hypothetical protein NQZ70_05009 [Sorangium sp. Soce836]
MSWWPWGAPRAKNHVGSGAALWRRTFTDAITAFGELTIDHDDGVALVGAFLGTVDFGAGPLTAERTHGFVTLFAP